MTIMDYIPDTYGTETLGETKKVYHLMLIWSNYQNTKAFRKALHIKQHCKNKEYTSTEIRRNVKFRMREKDVARKRFDRCIYCGNYPDRPTVEHFVPKYAGGADSRYNLLIACNDCNQAVGIMPVHEKIEYAIDKRVAKRLRDMGIE